MDAGLEAIKDAWDKNTGDGRDESARKLADAYIAEHVERFAGFKDLSLEQLVQALEVFRVANMEQQQWEIEAYLLSRFEPQNIGGEYNPQLRLPNS